MRLKILVLVLLLGCNDDMQFTQQGIISSIASQFTDTTADGKQVTVVIGDSNADGRGESVPVVASETLYLYSGGSISEITTQEVDNDAGNTWGSAWQQYATEKKSLTGYKTVLVNAGKGGAEFYPNGDNDNWYTSGTLYDAMKTNVSSCLSLLSLSKPKTIIVVLGVNDIRSANTVGDISTGITSLFDRLNTDYPDVPILVSMPGRNEASTAANTEKSYDVRRLLQTEALSRSYVHIVGACHTFTGTSMVQVDNLHFTQAGYNAMGNWYARWEANSAYSKWGRSVISSMFDDLSSTRKTLIDDFIDAQVTSGNYVKWEHFGLYRTTEVNNISFDWTFLGYIANSGGTFTANSNLKVNGNTSSTIIANYTPSLFNEQSTATDLIVGARTGTMTTTSGTAAGLFGGSDGTNSLRIAQSATLINGSCNSATNFNGTDTNIQSNILYSIARNGNDEYLLKGTTTHATRNLAGTGTSYTQTFRIGCLNLSGGGGLVFPINSQILYSYAAKYSDLDFSGFYTDVEYLIAHWND